MAQQCSWSLEAIDAESRKRWTCNTWSKGEQIKDCMKRESFYCVVDVTPVACYICWTGKILHRHVVDILGYSGFIFEIFCGVMNFEKKKVDMVRRRCCFCWSCHIKIHRRNWFTVGRVEFTWSISSGILIWVVKMMLIYLNEEKNIGSLLLFGL